MQKSMVLKGTDIWKQVMIEASKEPLSIINGVSFTAYEGEFISIVGPSGSGKTTLLHCLFGLTQVSKGTVEIMNTEITKLNLEKKAKMRQTMIGFIFQEYNLLSALPAIENVLIPLRLAKKKIDYEKVNQVLDNLTFTASKQAFVHTLSGGERQKLAIARVLLSENKLVFADEPTGALDSQSRELVFEQLKSLTKMGICVIMVTHDIELAAQTDRTYVLKDGRVVTSLLSPTSTEIFKLLNEKEAG
ncbi:ABC transporter ATP-binding protein [Enterococcus phoeniculicola]|nr:ABC transporter ATP-binding protein [Enterococcus phoeniculicola]